MTENLAAEPPGPNEDTPAVIEEQVRQEMADAPAEYARIAASNAQAAAAGPPAPDGHELGWPQPFGT